MRVCTGVVAVYRLHRAKRHSHDGRDDTPWPGDARGRGQRKGARRQPLAVIDSAPPISHAAAGQIIAAHRLGLRQICVPIKNRKDVRPIPPSVSGCCVSAKCAACIGAQSGGARCPRRNSPGYPFRVRRAHRGHTPGCVHRTRARRQGDGCPVNTSWSRRRRLTAELD